MAALDSIYSGSDINKNLNPSYTGPLFRVWSRGSGTTVFVDIEQNANGEADLAKFQAEENLAHDWAYYAAYDQFGSTDWCFMLFTTAFEWDNNRWNKFWDQASQTFPMNANENLIIPKRSSGIDKAISCSIPTSTTEEASISDIPLGQYSIFIRQKILSPTPSTIRGMVGFKDNVLGKALRAVENSSSALQTNIGSPNYYKDGVIQNITNSGEAWAAFANQNVNIVGIVNFDSSIDRTVTEPFYVFNPYDGNEWEPEYFTSILMYTGDVGTSVDDTQVTEIQTLIEGVYDPVMIPSFTFTDEVGSPVVNAPAIFCTFDAFDSKNPDLTTLTQVGTQYTTDANGVATYDPNLPNNPAIDSTKVYTAISFKAVAGSTEMEPIYGIAIGRQNVNLTLPA